MKEKKRVAGRVVAWLLIFVLGLAGGILSVQLWDRFSPRGKKIAEIKSTMEREYLYWGAPESDEEWLYAGLLAYTNDPYAQYYTPKEYQRQKEDWEGNFVGIGASVVQNNETDIIVFTSVTPGSPAEEAGVQAGDILRTVDGTPMAGIILSDVVSDYIRGEAGTDVVLGLENPDTGEGRELTVTRAEIHTQSVDYTMLESGMGYVLVTEFLEETEGDFKTAVDALEAQGAKGFVVDLRENLGGNLDTAAAMADYLLRDDQTVNSRAYGKTSILYTEDKRENSVSYFAGDGHSVEKPIAILLNGNSASASELFSGALRDNGQAVLVGENSFGKGIVQSIFELADGSAMKLTTHQYFTPSGFALQGQGLAPDVEAVGAAEGVEEELAQRMEKVADDSQVLAAVGVLQEMIQGTRTCAPLAGEDTAIGIPEGYLERAEKNDRKLPGMGLTVEALDEQLGALAERLGCWIYSRRDNWQEGEDVGITDAKFAHEIKLSLTVPGEEDQCVLTLWADPVNKQVSLLEISKFPAEIGVGLTLGLLEMEGSLSPQEREEVETQLRALEKGGKYSFKGTEITVNAALSGDEMTVTLERR